MKKIIILKDGGGRLANQLWNYASIYAYCLEKNYRCYNYVFYRYHDYFDIPHVSVFEEVLSRVLNITKNYKLVRILNFVTYKFISLFYKKNIIKDDGRDFNLPPSFNPNFFQRSIIDFVDTKNKDFYFTGWLFRNPEGLKKNHGKISLYFRPKEKYYTQVISLKKELQQKYKLIVGVHVRQGDYKTWQGGKFFFSCHEVALILRDFVEQQKYYKLAEIVFVICSDGHVEETFFSGLNIANGPGSEITDLYMLAHADLIIGSNSTYGTWAAYYGQIPFFEFSRKKINWENKFIPS